MSSFGLSLCPQGMHELLAPIVFVLHCDHQAFQHASETASPRSVPPSCEICTLRRCRGRRMFAFICIIFVSQWGDEVPVEPSVPWARCLVSRNLFKSKLVPILPFRSLTRANLCPQRHALAADGDSRALVFQLREGSEKGSSELQSCRGTLSREGTSVYYGDHLDV